MVFPSIPVCLDPPSWSQQQAVQVHQEAPQLPHPGGGNMSSSAVRPVSTAERARLAKIPQPEPALRCPRCDSSNTKFCYFNNYSLTQPRHFCKTCRRYWTRGGALRNVPVGGGCRRNKRAKTGTSTASSSKPPAAATEPAHTSTAGTVGAHQLPQLPFMGSLHPLPQYVNPNLGLSFGRMQPLGTEGGAVGLDSLRLQQQIQQFPFMGGLEGAQAAPVTGLYSAVGSGGSLAGQVQMKASSSGVINTQLASVQMEDSSQSIHFPRQYGLNFPQNMNNFWSTGGGGGGSNINSNTGGGGQWTDLSGFNSSSGNLI